MVNRHTIAHVNTEMGFSGGEVQVFLLMQGLRKHGLRNVLFCRPSSEVATRARELGIEVQTVPMRNDLHLTAVVRMAVRFARGSVELAHLHSGRANWLGGLAARIAGVPAITTRRMDRRVGRGLSSRILYRHLVRRAVAISPAVAQLLTDAGVPEQKILTIPSSVDPTALAPRVPAADTRAAWSAGADDVVLLALARLTHRKGLDVLLDALVRLGQQHGLRPTLWIGGEGPEQPALVEQVARLGLGAQVRFLGRRDDVPDLLAACDVFVMPSRQEGLGIAALEAMAAGRPVVGSKVGGLADAVVDGGTGRLVPPEDAEALAAALGEVVGDAALRQRLGAAGPGRIREGFHAEQMVESYLDVYRRVLEEIRVAW